MVKAAVERMYGDCKEVLGAAKESGKEAYKEKRERVLMNNWMVYESG